MSVYEFRKATLGIEEGNIVVIRLKDDVELESHDVMEIFAKRRELIGENRYAVVFIGGQHSSLTTEARKLAAEPEHAVFREALALVVNSLAQRMVGNFYIRFDNPPSPTRLFTDEDKAMTWVKTFRGIGNH